MFKFVILFSVLLGLSLCTEEEYIKNLPRLAGGFLAVWGQYPSAASLDSPFNLHCGATIVNANHLITSAQCVLNETHQLTNQNFLRITAGDLNLIDASIYRETRDVSAIYVHPRFNPFTLENDIAVLRVNQSFPEFHNTIQPARRRNRIVMDTTVCSFAGWGTTAAPNTPIQTLLRRIDLPVIGRDACNAPLVHSGRVNESMLCAGALIPAPPNTGVCHGNKGGALFCNDEFTGILSNGISCGAVNQPGVFTQVRFFDDWINQQFLRTDIPAAGSIPFGP